MIPNTNNTALLFVSTRPAWEHGVTLRMSMKTDVFDARSGLQQRQGRQTGAKWEMKYTAILDRVAALARHTRALAEVRAPLIVPMWTERSATTSAITANVVTIDRAADADFFRAGDYVYFSSGLGDQFRQIASVDGDELTLEPDGGAIAYLTGDTAGATFEAPSEDSQSEPLTYATL